MEELKAQAEDLGIEVDGRWSEKRIQTEIDKALGADPVEPKKPEPKQKAGMIIKNMRPNPMKRLGLPGFGFCTLTDEQMCSEQFMKRIRHGIETGALSEL
ncbi:MAG: hypothetical protein K5804_17995 [Microbacterium sp.]|uniref:hypothetical protein n=1 Tax=Microbacterium sp. TaxID=51671 RepID=UPI0026293502|nr:hypothetical protein [Microbacterium sp.]MCV0420138.1 hypothetical protein [Microbacterium sp.]